MTLAHNAGPSPRSSDVERAAELRRIKLVATAVLGGCLVLLAVSRALEGRHPAFGFLAAFAEAAVIGGLADWYAVVALFRRPLGLPIPHTAIIPANQQRIADKLGEFVEQQFLDAAPVEARLNQIDFASYFSDWLDDRKRSGDLARFMLRLLPEAISAAESSGLKSFVARRVQAQLQSIDFTPLAAGTLRTFVAERGHQRLLDNVMEAVHQALNQPETLAAIREKIRDELPTLLKFYRADAYLMKKVAASATSFLDDVRSNPEHPLRGEIDRLALSLIERLETDPGFAARLRRSSGICCRAPSSASSPSGSGPTPRPSSSEARQEKSPSSSIASPSSCARWAPSSRTIQKCGRRSTGAASPRRAGSSPNTRAAFRPSSPTR